MLVAVLNLFFALLQRGVPAPKPRRWVSWGGLLGSALWLAGSAGFSWYVTYVSTGVGAYGALGTGLVFLGWVWLGSFAMLLGVEVDVRLVERRRFVPVASIDS